jgi:hypothetical protein
MKRRGSNEQSLRPLVSAFQGRRCTQGLWIASTRPWAQQGGRLNTAEADRMQVDVHGICMTHALWNLVKSSRWTHHTRMTRQEGV